MKRLCFITGLMIVLFAISCKKAKGPANVRSAQQDNSVDSALSINTVINGVSWKTDSIYSYKIKSSANDTEVNNLMVIATLRKNNVVSTITFNISNFEGIKEYVVNPPQYSITYYVGNVRHVASSGVFNVLSDSNKVYAGSFYFVADSINATNGTFKVAIPQ